MIPSIRILKSSIKILLVVQHKHPQLLKIKSPPVFEDRTEPAVIHLLPAELHDLYQLGQLAFEKAPDEKSCRGSYLKSITSRAR